MNTPELISHANDQDDAWLRDTIKRCGWAITYVFGESGEPPFGYTIGLTERHRPELIIFGANQDTTAYALNYLAARFVVEGPPAIDRPVTFAGAAHRAWLVPVPDSSEHLLWANNRYQSPDGPPIPALQVVYDDDQGRFPWDPGYDIPHWLQPVLGKPPDP